MSVMLTPDQIPTFWNAIKFAAVKVSAIEDEFRESYLNRLLYSLLSGKAQCFIELSDERKLRAIAITKVLTDELSDMKVLLINTLYAFERSDDVWSRGFKEFGEFARSKDCKAITCYVSSDKLFKICESLGMTERFRSFTLYL